MGGVTSTRVTRPSAVTQKRTSWRLPCASRGAPGGGEIAHSGVAAKISLAAPVPGPSPGPPAVPSPVPTAAGGRGVIATTGGGTSSFTGSVIGAAIVGTVTAGAGGSSCTVGADGVGRANQVSAGRPPPPPPPRGPDPPPPPPSNNSAPRHSARIAIARCTASESAAAGPWRRRGSGSAYALNAGRVVSGMVNTYPITKTGARFRAPAFTNSPESLVSSRRSRLYRREPDHLHPGAPRDVHGAHDVAVLAIRRGFDEQELRGTLVVQLVELGIELLERDRLRVDCVRAVGPEVQYDLIALLLLLLRLILLFRWDLYVEVPARERQRDHEDDQQHEQHVDHRRDVDVRTQTAARAARSHRHRSVPFRFCRAFLLGDRADDAHARFARDFERGLDPPVLNALIGLEIQDLVDRAIRVEGRELPRQVSVTD